MLDEIRDHAASSSMEERQWIDSDVVGILARALALGAVALVIGIAASVAVGYPVSFPTLVVSAPH
ncbi:MAG: hypothetical protein ACXWAC_02690 [Usitatibacter sp.]